MDRGRALPLAILFAINVLNFYDRQALGAITEPLRKEFHLSDTEIGALTTLFTVVYALAGVPLGRAADTWNRGKLLAGGVALWTALTAAAGFASSYPVLLLSRLGVGVGEAVCAPAATSWIGDLFGARERSRALAVFMLGVPVGAMLSYAISGPVAQAFGWRAALVLAALPALVLVPAVARLREPRRGAAETYAGADARPPVRSLLRIRTLWWIVASGALVNFNLYVLAAFLPAFLTRFHGLSVAQAGVWAGIGHGAAGIAGGLTAGLVGDRILRVRRNGRLLAAALAALLASPISLAGIARPAGDAATAVLAMMISYGLLNMYYGLVYSSIQDVVSPSLRGTTMALYFMAMYLCGASFGPVITGGLSDRFARAALASGAGPEAAKAIGLHQAMYILPAISAGLALVLWAGSRTVAKDMERRDRAEAASPLARAV